MIAILIQLVQKWCVSHRKFEWFVSGKFGGMHFFDAHRAAE